MNFTVHQLQVFLRIAETGSLTKAAESLHLSQPAVSIQLRNFQDQFDQPLTETIGRKVYLTAWGKEIAQQAEQVENALGYLDQMSRSKKGDLQGKLKLAIVSTGKYVMPYFLKDFLELHPNLSLQMDVTNKAGVLKSLENNEADFCLVSILPEKLKLEKIELLSNKLYLVGPADYRWPTKNRPKALEKLNLIYREQGSGTRLTMEKFLKKYPQAGAQKMSLTSNEAVKQAILAGLGFSIMPLIGIKNELKQKDLQLMPFPGLPVSTQWYLVWLPGKQFSPAAKAYLEHIRLSKNKIIQEAFEWTRQYE